MHMRARARTHTHMHLLLTDKLWPKLDIQSKPFNEKLLSLFSDRSLYEPVSIS